MFVGGEWVAAVDGGTIETINPYTTEVWATIPRGQAEDARRAVDAAYRALKDPSWSRLTASRRGAMLRALASLIERDAEQLAAIESRDNGKLSAEIRGVLRYVPQIFHYYAGLADKIEGAVLPVDRPGFLTYTKYEPLGVVVAITPWNSPLLIAAAKCAPALAAGCTVILKPSESTSASALELARLFEEAGFPAGVFNVVTGYGNEIGEALVSDKRVAKISFTGGDAGGRRINETAASDFKHVSLELGGKSPNIIFDDADLEQAARGAVAGIFTSSGQSCIAGSRLLVQRGVHDQVVRRVIELAKPARIGDPSLPETNVGPVATAQQLDKILGYIDIARAGGAECVLGGKRVSEDRWLVEPTIFTGVTSDMRIAQEEVFGPILAVIPFDDEDDAIRIANDTIYGLAAGLWTQNIRRALRVANAIDAGTVWVNNYRMVSLIAPFGGYKHSGIGRENGIAAIHEYLQSKTIWIDYENELPDPFAVRI